MEKSTPECARPNSAVTATVSSVTLDELTAHARTMIAPGQRRFIGITGAPGSGKSTLGELLANAIGADAAFVALDGYHLADDELQRLGSYARKGAVDTFDASGFLSLLRRLRSRDDLVVYAPRFDRALEAAIAGSVPILRDVPLVITEGNYLLVDAPVWNQIPALLDCTWFVDPGEDVRIERLIARHIRFGSTPAQALARSWGSDQINAELIVSTRERADRVIRLAPDPRPDTANS